MHMYLYHRLSYLSVANQIIVIGQLSIPAAYMYRALLTTRCFYLPLSISRIYLSSIGSQVSVRMVSMKTLPVCDADSLKDGEMSVILIADDGLLFPHVDSTLRKEVDFGNGKVLLSKLGDKVHATSAYCTHYGAPLVGGVLVADGRVVWCVHPAMPSSVYSLN